MASASSNTSLHRHELSVATGTEPKSKVPVSTGNLGPPGLLRCLIYSWNDQRVAALRAAAEREAWEVIVSGNAMEFLRHVFRQKVPLTLVDLPGVQQADYERIREMTAKVNDVSDALLILCGNQEDAAEEMWARQLGVWSYLPEVCEPDELDWVFVEARKAVAQSASSDLKIPVPKKVEKPPSGAGASVKRSPGKPSRMKQQYADGEMNFFPQNSRRENHVHRKKKI